LRTGNLYSPWPEEANRVLVSRLAALHFAPTAAARANLLGEGVPADHVHLTGPGYLKMGDMFYEDLMKAYAAAKAKSRTPSAASR